MTEEPYSNGGQLAPGVVHYRNDTGKPIPVRSPADSASFVFGTDPSCDVRIDDPYVSGRHARVWRDDDGVWVEDLGSTNGTWIGQLYFGQRVTLKTRLRPGDVLWMGRTRIPWTG